MKTIKDIYTVYTTSDLADLINAYLKNYPVKEYGTYFMAKTSEFTINYVTGEYEWVPVDVQIKLTGDKFINPFNTHEPMTVEICRYEEPSSLRDRAATMFGVPNDLYFNDYYFSQAY